MFYRRAFKVLLIAIVVFTISTVAYAFAAANTVPDTYAGDGSGAISGYTVSNIQYNLVVADPSTIDSVDFDLDAAAGQASVSFDNGLTWTACTNPGGMSWNCDVNVTVLPAASLRVVATS